MFLWFFFSLAPFTIYVHRWWLLRCFLQFLLIPLCSLSNLVGVSSTRNHYSHLTQLISLQLNLMGGSPKITLFLSLCSCQTYVHTYIRNNKCSFVHKSDSLMFACSCTFSTILNYIQIQAVLHFKDSLPVTQVEGRPLHPCGVHFYVFWFHLILNLFFFQFFALEFIH